MENDEITEKANKIKWNKINLIFYAFIFLYNKMNNNKVNNNDNNFCLPI